MISLIMAKKERELLFSRIETLQHELNAYKDDAAYYRRVLDDTRARIMTLQNIVKPDTMIDRETPDQGWLRVFDACIEKLKTND